MAFLSPRFHVRDSQWQQGTLLKGDSINVVPRLLPHAV